MTFALPDEDGHFVVADGWVLRAPPFFPKTWPMGNDSDALRYWTGQMELAEAATLAEDIAEFVAAHQ